MKATYKMIFSYVPHKVHQDPCGSCRMRKHERIYSNIEDLFTALKELRRGAFDIGDRYDFHIEETFGLKIIRIQEIDITERAKKAVGLKRK